MVYLLKPTEGENACRALCELARAAGPGDTVRLEAARVDFYEKDAYEYRISLSNAETRESRRAAVYLRGAKGVTIDGGGAELIFHGELSAFALDGCEGVTLRNFSINWERPLDAEGVVEDCDGTGMRVFVDPEKYPWHVRDGQLMFVCENGEEAPLAGMMEFDGETLRIPPHTGDRMRACPARALDGAHVWLETPKVNPPVKKGTIWVLRHSARFHPALVAHNCKDTAFEDAAVHASAGLGSLFQFGENARICRVRYVPDASRGRRVLSSHVDAIQASNMRGDFRVSECAFHGLMDDCINAHGTFTVAACKTGDRAVEGAFGHRYSKDFAFWARPGDTVGFLSAEDMITRFTMTVEDYALLPSGRFALRFSRALPEAFAPGMVMENESASPNVHVENCLFASNRARGMLLSVRGKCEIVKNVFESSGSAILMAGDANYWYEAGACADVLISDNVFDRCNTSPTYQFCGGVISLWPETEKPNANECFHTHIRIERNTFIMTRGAALYAKSAQVEFTNNRLFYPPDAEEAPNAVIADCARVDERGTVRLLTAGR